jgi:hypothetical protein
MEKLDSVVAEHIELRLLQPKRLEQILSRVLDRRKESAERRTAHIAELRRRAAKAEAKLKRLYDVIENGVADVSDPMQRVIELKSIPDQARANAERVAGALDRLGRASRLRHSKPSPAKPAGGCGLSPAAIAATTSARSPGAWKWTRKRFASWG